MPFLPHYSPGRPNQQIDSQGIPQMAAHSTARQQVDTTAGSDATPSRAPDGIASPAPPQKGWNPYEVWRTRVLNAAPGRQPDVPSAD